MRVPVRSVSWLILIALICLSGGCSRNPNARKQKYFDSGMQYFQRGQYQEAAIQFQNAIQLDKSFAQAHSELAQCYLRLKLWPLAYKEFLIDAELEPKNLQVQLDLANFLFAAGHFQDARDRAESILKDNPTEVRAQLLLATSDGELGDLKKAIEEAKQGVQMAPDQAGPYLTLGFLQEKGQDLQAAEKNLGQAVAKDPRMLLARLGLASFYQRQKRWTEAEAQYRGAIDVGSSNPIVWTSFASLYAAWGKRDLAEQTLQDAKKAMPNDPNAYRLLGDFYVTTGETEKARSEFATLLREHPGDLFLKRRYIGLLIQNKQFDEAMQLNDEILKRDPKDAESLISKGQVLDLKQRASEAVPILETAAKGDPENPAGHLELGVAYFRTGNFAGAETEWHEAVKLKPSFLDAWRNLSILALRKGDVHLLEDSASELLKSSGSAPQGYLLRGIARMKKGDTQGAESDLRKSSELDPKNATTYTRLGDLRLLQKRYADAGNCYELALSNDPNATEALQGLLAVFLAQKQPGKALRRVQAQVAIVPNNSIDHVLLGEALLANHQSSQAQNELEKAVALDKTNLNAFLLLAQVLEMTGQSNAAASTYEDSIRENPQQVGPYISLGVFEERRGNWQKAEELYRKALVIQPDQPAAANNLSYLLLEHGGDINYALSLAQTARSAMPDSPNSGDTLAWAYYKIGAYDSATPLLQEAIIKSPQNPTYYYHLGLVYWKSGKVALAKTNFERSLRLDPKSSRAGEIHQVLAQLSSAQ
jgi:cellulose synthase operon protein C